MEIEEDEEGMDQPPLSPPHDTFQDVEFANEPLDVDRAIIPNLVLVEESIDERVIVVAQFLSNNEFIQNREFKSFWLQEKLKELSEE